MNEKHFRELAALLGVEPVTSKNHGFPVPGKIVTPTLKGVEIEFGEFSHNGISVPMKDKDFEIDIKAGDKGEFKGTMKDSDFDPGEGFSKIMKHLGYKEHGNDIHKALEEKRTTIVKGDPLVFTSDGEIIGKGFADTLHKDGTWSGEDGFSLFRPENKFGNSYETYKVVKKSKIVGFVWPLNIGTCKEHCIKMEK